MFSKGYVDQMAHLEGFSVWIRLLEIFIYTTDSGIFVREKEERFILRI